MPRKEKARDLLHNSSNEKIYITEGFKLDEMSQIATTVVTSTSEKIQFSSREKKINETFHKISILSTSTFHDIVCVSQ